jgi:predicted DNA-binding antitoxin AbrB/MazE fold protein
MATQVTEAIYTAGVLKPVGTVSLQESQLVRLIIDSLDSVVEPERSTALGRLRAGIEQMNFFLSEPLPSRDELHDRA